MSRSSGDLRVIMRRPGCGEQDGSRQGLASKSEIVLGGGQYHPAVAGGSSDFSPRESLHADGSTRYRGGTDLLQVGVLTFKAKLRVRVEDL